MRSTRIALAVTLAGTLAAGMLAACSSDKKPSADSTAPITLNVVGLLPGAKPATLEASARFWASVPELPAVRDRRVYTITAPYALLPGPRLADLAEQLADDLLKVANATNAAASLANRFPSIDREKLLSLRPEAVVVLLPDAKPAALEASARFWGSMAELPAVRDRRVYTITAPWSQVPGPRLAELAEQFADDLHPETATTRPTATSAPATRDTPK